MNDLNRPEVICYLCGIVDDNIKRERSIQFINSAAENKVLGICDALKPHARHVVAVSVGRGGVRNDSRFPAVVRRVSNIPVLYAAFWHNRYLSFIITALSLVLLLFRVKKLSKGKRICLIAYNRVWFYFPMLCFSRLLKVDCYLDLEDAPAVRKASLFRQFISWGQVRVFDALCDKGAICASSLLLNQLHQKQKLVCHGVASQREKVSTKKFSDEAPVRLLFGGHLSQETGAQLFMDSIRLLDQKHKDICGKIQVVVTGKGPLLAALEEFSLNDGRCWIDYHGEVSLPRYRCLLEEVDIGLCLKLPSSDMCSTTFPSKVVEYASFGKAVLSTGIKDVVNLFGSDGAYLLEDESVEGLVEMMRRIALEPNRIGSIAELGQKRLIEKSGKDAVAKNIMKLFSYDVEMS